MKKFLSVMLCVLFSLSLSVSVLAAETTTVDKTNRTIELEDGATVSIITTIFQEEALRAGVARKSASKEYTYSYRGEDLWSYTLYASFDSDGTATAAADTYSIYDDNWDLDSNDTYTSGNTAYGEATFSTGMTRKSVDLSLTCDEDGNID